MKNKITLGLGFGAVRVRESESEKGFVGFGKRLWYFVVRFRARASQKCCGDCGGTKNGIFQCLVIRRELPTMAVKTRGGNHQ
jgi:hypothetical protein